MEFKRLKESYFKLFSDSDFKTEIKQADIIDKSKSNFITQKINGKTGILILKQKIKESKLFAFDIKFFDSDIYLCLCWSTASTYFIKVERGECKELFESFKDIFESDIKKIVFNHKAISKILHNYDIKINNFFDIKIGSYLISPGARNDFKAILSLNSNIDINDDELNLENVYYYEELFLKINQELKDKNLLTLQNEIENPLSSVCLLYTSPSPRDKTVSRMPSSA